ncbi:Serine protease, subtilase family [Sandaracinus amylolyticus]|uniref:Serine protease, subtilase family n=1 Tax=Sandaracinus amylolyticus TaxID=927083 RepID=A0A0F6SHR6_9BACT|nr:Serine protease, subtilase family [Sandaracinus amylolyticus]
MLTGCAASADPSLDAASKPEDGPTVVVPESPATAFHTSATRPTFGVALDTQLDALRFEGRAQDHDWPRERPSDDEIVGALTAYDRAFHGWAPSARFATLRPLTRASCERGAWDPAYYDELGPAMRAFTDRRDGAARNRVDDDGDGAIDECDDLDGADTTWVGRARAAARALEPAPLDAVEHHGVRFEPRDVRALLAIMHGDPRALVIGDRCTLDRPARRGCAPINAGAFHLLLGNVVGDRERALAIERDDGESAVIDGYRVVLRLERGEAEVLRLLGGRESALRPSRWVELVVDVDVDAAVERHHFLLAVDARGHVIGGEWIADGARPAWAWLPVGAGASAPVRVDHVRALLRSARADLRERRTVELSRVVDRLVPDWPEPGVSSAIEVRDHVVAERATVHVELLHEALEDAQVVLHRGLDRVVLFDRNPRGGDEGWLWASFTIDEVAGDDAYGQWELFVVDRERGAIGHLLRWSLELEVHDPSAPSTTLDGAQPPRFLRTYTTVGAPLDVPDALSDGLESTIAVHDDVLVERAIVHARVTHPYRGDLRVVLEHEGLERVLHDRTGAGADDLAIELDARELAGMHARGAWTLRVEDHAPGDVGRLEGWALELAGR